MAPLPQRFRPAGSRVTPHNTYERGNVGGNARRATADPEMGPPQPQAVFQGNKHLRRRAPQGSFSSVGDPRVGTRGKAHPAVSFTALR
jgi:hypothetical protein